MTMAIQNFVAVPVRSARARVTLAGNDISQNLDPSKTSFSYSDHCEGKGDSISIELEDLRRSWIQENFPLKGSKLEAYIVVTDWRFIGDNHEQSCGSFTIDSVSFKGPPNTVSIKANSIPTNSKVKGTNNIRAWEDTTFQEVAQQIAKENGMTCQFECGNEQFKRMEQMDQSDLAFLQNYADECGLSLKVTDNKLVFFDEEEYEKREPVDTIQYGVNVLTWSFSSKLTDTVKGVTSTYQNPKTGQLTTEGFERGEQDEEGALTGNERYLHGDAGEESDDPGMAGRLYGVRFAPFVDPDLVGSLDIKNDDPAAQKGKGKGRKTKAARRAKKEARKANKDGDGASFALVGNPLLCGGKTVDVKGFGKFDARYIIQTATHKLSRSGYTTDLKLTKVLKGY